MALCGQTEFAHVRIPNLRAECQGADQRAGAFNDWHRNNIEELLPGADDIDRFFVLQGALNGKGTVGFKISYRDLRIILPLKENLARVRCEEGYIHILIGSKLTQVLNGS